MVRQTRRIPSLQAFLPAWLQVRPQAPEARYQQMLSLDESRTRALELLPSPELTPRLQQALEILCRQACLSQSYQQRCRAIEQAGLLPQQQAELRLGLADRYQQAVASLMLAWPPLESAELDALPLLLMRQRLDQEIDQKLEALRLELHFGACAPEGAMTRAVL